MGLRDQLRGILPPELLPRVSDHFEVIGNVAVIRIDPLLKPYRQAIAQSIVSRRKNIVTVLEKTEKIAGDSRTAGYEILLGNPTVTVHREAGFSYRLDVTGSFFSPRMVSERKRVTGLVQPGEQVYVPFAGIGPFVIPAAARGAEVWAVEQNPDAFRWLSMNCALNRVSEHCHLIPGDALDTPLLPVPGFDRIIIPAPYGMDHALYTLLPLLSPRGMVHFYTFKTRQEIPGLVREYTARGLAIKHSAACGNVAPGVSRRVFDLVWR